MTHLNKLLLFMFSFNHKGYYITNKDFLSIMLAMILLFIATYSAGILCVNNYKTNKVLSYHAVYSLHMAMNQYICNTGSTISSTYLDSLNNALTKDLDDHSLQGIAIIDYASKVLHVSNNEYCNLVKLEFVKNESTLKWLDFLVIKLTPDVTFASLQQIPYCFCMVNIFVVCTILIYLGFSPFIGIASAIAIAVSYTLVFIKLPYSVYPFLIPFVLTYLMLIAVLVYTGWHMSFTGLVFSIICLSLFAAFFFNLRTSYLPLIVTNFLLFLCSICMYNIKHKIHYKYYIPKIILGLLLFVSCFCYANSKLASSNSEKSNCRYHGIAHPLVLALGVEESNLSKREGIRWNDDCGQILVRKNAKISYDNSEACYEKILFSYYIELWTKYTGEMLQIYFKKWFSVFHGGHKFIVWQQELLKIIPSCIMLSMVYFLFKKKYFSIMKLAAFWLLLQTICLGYLYFSGVLYSVWLLGAVVLSFRKMSSYNLGVFTFMVSVGLTAFLIMLEASLILHTFSKQYYSIFLLFMLMIVFYLINCYVLKMLKGCIGSNNNKRIYEQ